MNQDSSEVSAEGRRSPRVELDGNVSVRLARAAIVGSGQNISDQGVFFVTDGDVPVEVEIEGRDGALLGKLVRVESMGGGAVGIAVKFDEMHPDLVDGSGA